MTDTSKASAPKRALGATLAGVLAVGMVPAVAFAAEPGDVDDTSLEELAATEAQAVTAGTITYTGGTSFTLNSSNAATGVGPVLTGVQPLGAGVAALDLAGVKAISPWTNAHWYAFPVSTTATANTVSGFTAPDGSQLYLDDVAGSVSTTAVPDSGKVQIRTPGTYAAVLANDASAANVGALANPIVTKAVIFTVSASALSDATITYRDEEISSVTYNGGVWGLANGSANQLVLSVAGQSIAPADFATNFNVTYYSGGNGQGSVVTNPTYGGSYTAVITGQAGSPWAGQTAKIPFTIAPLDLSTATYSVKDIQVASGAAPYQYDVLGLINSINAITPTNLKLSNGGTFYLSASVSSPATTTGAYTAQISLNTAGIAASDAAGTPLTTLTTPTAAQLKASITGTGTITFDVVKNAPLANTAFKYGTQTFGNTFGSGSDPLTIDLSKAKPAYFDPEKVSVTGLTPDDAYMITYTDKNGAEVDLDTVNSVPGTYYAVVEVDSAATGYAYGGSSDTMEIVTTRGQITTNTIVFSLNGTVLDGSTTVTKPYIGASYNIQTAVYLASGAQLSQDDYTVTITGPDGTEVDSIMDAGTYTLTVESDTYTMPASGNTLTFQVAAQALTSASGPATTGNIRIVDLLENDFNGTPLTDEYAWLYTGSPITPKLQFLSAAGTWVDVDPDQYGLSLKYNADATGNPSGSANAIEKPGVYEVSITAPEETPAVQNVTVASSQLVTISNESTVNNSLGHYYVTDEDIFADVPASGTWFSTAVYQARENGYMFGVAGTRLFMPFGTLTRAQAAIVMFNMGGGRTITGGTTTWPSKFADVASDAYYAEAVYFTSSAGIVNGYAGTDLFGPEATVSREQFAAMLCNYAQATGRYAAPSAEQLAAVHARADWNSVSVWARPAVEWAVANGYLGANASINPQGNIIRAEAAAITTRFQPDGLPNSIFSY